MRNKLYIFLIVFLLYGCGVYSLSGINIQPNVKSISIQNFPNNATLVAPQLSQVLSDKLKQKFIQETRLSYTSQAGDWDVKGSISNYSITPVSIGDNSTTQTNRLTITVDIDFVSVLYPEDNFTQSFSQFTDFSATDNFQSKENALIDDITNKLIQDIFNKIALKW